MNRFSPSFQTRRFDDGRVQGIPRDALEDERKQREHSISRDISGLVIDPSPVSSADVSVEYGRNQPTSRTQDLAAVASFVSRPPPHNAADYNHILDDHEARHRLQTLAFTEEEDSLGLTGLGVSQSSAGHHVSNATVRAGLGHTFPITTPSRQSDEPTRDVQQLRRLQARSGLPPQKGIEDQGAGKPSRERADNSITPRPSRAMASNGLRPDQPHKGQGPGHVDLRDVYSFHPGTTHGHEGDDSRSVCALDSPSPFSSKDASPRPKPVRARLSDALDVSKFSPKGQQPTTVPGNRYNIATRVQTGDHSGEESEQGDSPGMARLNQVHRTQAVVEEPGSSSQFDVLAHGLRRDIAAEQAEAADLGHKRSPHNINHPEPVGLRNDRPVQAQPTRNTITSTPATIIGSVHLPDMTGLTSAVATPAKADASYIPYKPTRTSCKVPPLDHLNIGMQQSSKEDTLFSAPHHTGSLQSDLQRNANDLAKIKMDLAGPAASTARAPQSDTKRAGELARQLGADADSQLQNNQRLYATIADLKAELDRTTAEMHKREQDMQKMQASYQRHELAVQEAQRGKDAQSLQLQQAHKEIIRLSGHVRDSVGEVGRLRAIVEASFPSSKSRPSADHEPLDHFPDEEDERGDNYPSHLASPRPATEKRQLSPLLEVDEEALQETANLLPAPRAPAFERPNHIDVQKRDAVPDLSTDSASSQGTPLDPPEPSSPRFDESFHNTSILSMEPMVGSRRKVFAEDEDMSFLKEDVEERRSLRGSIQGSPSQPPRTLTPEPRSRQHGEHVFHGTAEGEGVRFLDRSDNGEAGHGTPRQRTRWSDAASVPPQPTIRDERVERLFRTAQHHDSRKCKTCAGQGPKTANGIQPSAIDVAVLAYLTGNDERATSSFVDRAVEEEERRRGLSGGRIAFEEKLRSQEVLAEAIHDLEDDFTHYRSVYMELAEQYGLIAPKSRIRRNILAQHLTEVIKVLERKGDLISTLYDLIAASH